MIRRLLNWVFPVTPPLSTRPVVPIPINSKAASITEVLAQEQERKTRQLSKYFPGTDMKWMNVQPGALYSSHTWEAGKVVGSGGGPPVQFFLNYYPGLTQVDTNVTQIGRLDAPEAFSICRVLLTFSRDAVDEDVYAIAENSIIEVWLGKKRYLHALVISLPCVTKAIAPIHICGYCQGVYANSATCPGCGAREFTLTTNAGDLDAGRQFAFDIAATPLPIMNQMSFFAQLITCPDQILRSRVKIWCHLEGMHADGVS